MMTKIPLVPYLLPWGALASDRRLGGIDSANALLLQTVLYDGLHQYCKSAFFPESCEFREEEEWLLTDDGDWPFSFRNLCMYFGVDPYSLREAMIRVRKSIRKEE